MSADATVTLRWLRRRLHRQLSLLRQERIDEALAWSPSIAENFERLRAFPRNEWPASCARLLRDCADLSDQIQPLLEKESRLLSREWLELEVERELARLSSDSSSKNR